MSEPGASLDDLAVPKMPPRSHGTAAEARRRDRAYATADASGDAQIWGLLGCQKEAAFAANRVIVVCEELVEESVIRADPNRTVIPGLIVDAVVEEPFACHPSFTQEFFRDRDNAFYKKWDEIARRRPRSSRGWTNGVCGLAGSHAE